MHDVPIDDRKLAEQTHNCGLIRVYYQCVRRVDAGHHTVHVIPVVPSTLERHTPENMSGIRV